MASKIPEHLLNSKLITDSEWEEYQELKEENKKLHERIKAFEEFVFEIYKDNYKHTKSLYLNDLLCSYYDDMDYASDFKLYEVIKGENK